MQTYLQNILGDIPIDNLPLMWQGFDYVSFSDEKQLFDFQQQALINTLKALHLYYREFKGEKNAFFGHYQANGLTENFDYDTQRGEERKTAQYLLQYDVAYPVVDYKISFAHFINRMSFWMATGAGKTLVIVKLIALLGKLAYQEELIPGHDILFLAHREDLIDQFKQHVDEFNAFHFASKINLKNLKDYEQTKHENALPFFNDEITVFYYRSDLISDEQKENIVDFRNYDNNGDWYIILDEAHKGDREDSKRQILYSILSRNGFLFNFSATFTDPRDNATCAFNYNLSKFIEDGYGKHIYISEAEVTAFRDQGDFSMQEKQKIVLKTLVLLTYIKKYHEKIREIKNGLYHSPLLLTLVNSVNTEDADLKLFFDEIEKIATGNLDNYLLIAAKNELTSEFQDNPDYVFENLDFVLDHDLINSLEITDILEYFFNADTSGRIEVLTIPGNRNELVFKLQTSQKPFALIKIGDISDWLKEKLTGYEIIESFDNESVFKKINQDNSDINLLMGSRAFYEGWDSNRPNVLLYINIGLGSEAKKFVLQSTGRGVRIEPQKNKRKRLLSLFNSGEINYALFNQINPYVLPIESLFVFGTNSENLKEIIRTLKEEKHEVDLGHLFMVNEEAQKHTLLIPVYKKSGRIYAEEEAPQKFFISQDDCDLANSYMHYLGEKIISVKYEPDIRVIKKIGECFQARNSYFDFSEYRSMHNPDILIKKLLNYFSVRSEDFGSYKKLEGEIVHFKKIKFSDSSKLEEIMNKINNVRQYEQKENALEQTKVDFSRHNDLEQYTLDIMDIERKYQVNAEFDINNQRIKIKYLLNHYYIPVVVSETDKVNYINHIIDVPSEISFINQLENYLNEADNDFQKFDWWMFSKLDEHLDEVYIPYYNPNQNEIAHFKPDFVFWIQRGNKYMILFIDPKGTEYTDGLRKIDGYSRLFETEGDKKIKEFSQGDLNIITGLLLKPRTGVASVPINYRKYWFDNFKDFFQYTNYLME